MFRFASKRMARLAARPLVRPFSSTRDRPFGKILIANRGEIACRVMRTCDAMDIETVAVYSEADSGAKHVRAAGEAVFIGGSESADSYLRIDRIIDACKKTGAEAVHPGYGFLSENEHFTAALDAEGIKFIGPKAHAMRVMGDKIESKKLAAEAGVNVIPGFVGEVKSEEEVLKVANEIGYPVMIKASAGGGGKGMRVAHNDAEAIEGFRLSKDEAQSSFGDDRMLIERFIGAPRHIELQVLADSFGNTVYLNERECSIQRRNQKVIEEAPSPFVDPELRRQMGEQAVQLAKAVQYESAGTVEMLVNANDRSFYFLEMNTRLQVEHPVTEYITGVDLVEQMIRVAAGQPLPFTQEQVPLKGWAVESRVYAEDPTRNFMPSIGRLVQYREPEDEDGNVRCESGVQEGSEISPYYDPMISKLVTYGHSRDEAIARNIAALDEYVVRGVKTNIGFLRELYEHKRFLRGDMTTNFIQEEFPEGFHGRVLDEKYPVYAVAAAMATAKLFRDTAITQRLVEDAAPTALMFEVGIDGESVDLMVVPSEEENALVLFDPVGGQRSLSQIEWEFKQPLLRAELDGEQLVAQYVDHDYNSFTIQYNGGEYKVNVQSLEEAMLSEHMPEPNVVDTSNSVLSPMPGKVVKVAVSKGDTVVAGQELLVVEAMKMQNVIRSDRNGVIGEVLVDVDSDVAVDQAMVNFQQ